MPEKFDFSKIEEEKIIEFFLNKNFPVIENGAEEKEKGPVKIKREEIEKLISFGETAEKLFNKIEKRGYLFHGSKGGDIEEFEPRKSVDLGKRLENLQEAIYATNVPAIAIFHAVKGEKGAYRSGWTRNINRTKDEFPIKFQANQTAIDNFGDGYIYVFEKQGFEHLGGVQFIKKEKCRPSHIIPVKKEDFQHEIEIIKDK